MFVFSFPFLSFSQTAKARSFFWLDNQVPWLAPQFGMASWGSPCFRSILLQWLQWLCVPLLLLSVGMLAHLLIKRCTLSFVMGSFSNLAWSHLHPPPDSHPRRAAGSASLISCEKLLGTLQSRPRNISWLRSSPSRARF